MIAIVAVGWLAAPGGAMAAPPPQGYQSDAAFAGSFAANGLRNARALRATAVEARGAWQA